MKLQIQADRASIKRYQVLLRAEWSKETIDDLWRLLWKLFSRSTPKVPTDWAKALAFSTQPLTGPDYVPFFLSGVQSFAKLALRSPWPTQPSILPLKKNRLAAQAQMAWSYLALPALVEIRGDIGFVKDLLSLLCLCSLQELLPLLAKQKLDVEHDCLVNAMGMHAMLVWKEQPAHAFFLQGQIMDYLGQRDQSLTLLTQSLQLTPVEDHAYLTKVYALWSEYMDQRQHAQAEALILATYRIAPPSYLDELKDLLDDTPRTVAVLRQT